MGRDERESAVRRWARASLFWNKVSLGKYSYLEQYCLAIQ